MAAEAEVKSQQFCQAWLTALETFLAQLSPGQWQGGLAPASESPESYAPSISLSITDHGALNGCHLLGFNSAAVTELLRLFLQDETLVASDSDPSQPEALEELVRQWAGLAATVLKPRFGEVTLELNPGPPSPAAAKTFAQLLSATGGSRQITVLLQVESNEAAASEPPAPLQVPAVHESSSSQVQALLRDGNLGLLMDVELGVMLRFGRRQALLREVLELAPGAVLELDREIQEPVDLLLNNRIIARGEVVVVDGNYGLRVTEVASPQQRVNSL